MIERKNWHHIAERKPLYDQADPSHFHFTFPVWCHRPIAPLRDVGPPGGGKETFKLTIGAAREAATVPDKIVLQSKLVGGVWSSYCRIGGPGKFSPVSEVDIILHWSKMC